MIFSLFNERFWLRFYYIVQPGRPSSILRWIREIDSDGIPALYKAAYEKGFVSATDNDNKTRHDPCRVERVSNFGAGDLRQLQLPGARHRLRAAVHTEFFDDAVNMGFDGAHADDQLPGYLPI